MSYLAIGATTQAIVELLTRKLNKPQLLGPIPNLTVSTLPPDDDRVGENTGLNLYLYRISESPYLKNMDWMGSRSSPGRSSKPALSITLHYLLTAYAKKVAGSFQDDVIAHQLLGNAISILHDNAVLNDVHDADFDADLDAQFAPELRDSFEKIKVSLLPTSMDEFSKIWTGLAKAYRLSMAYEVSLLQLAPLAARPAPRPPPRATALIVTPLAAPVLSSLQPSAGPVAGTIQLRGSGFVAGSPLRVRAGVATIEQADLSVLGGDLLELVLPEAVGPVKRIAVSLELDGRQSESLPFDVVPWIDGLRPLRGTSGIPVRFSCDVPQGQTVSVTVGGAVAAASYDASTRTVEVTIPPGISDNGLKDVIATLSGPPSARSNALSFELLPRVTGVALTSSGMPPSTTVTLQGARLAGSDVRIRYGSLLLNKGENLNASQLQLTLDRPLAAGAPVSVLVDGHESDVFPPVLEALEPASVLAGDLLTLRGRGLSGSSVVVHLGAADQNLGAQPFATRIQLPVPPGLPVGSLNVSVTVDGVDTGSATLTVNA